MGPEAYYAAGILVWAAEKNVIQFTFPRVKAWADEDVFGNLTGRYLQNSQLFEQAVVLLVGAGVVDHIDDPYGPHVLELKYDFPMSVLSEQMPGSVFDKTHRFGTDWLRDAIINLNGTLTQSDGVAAVERDDIWSPLPIDRSEDEYAEAIAGVEAAIRGIREDNGFAVELPAERANLIVHAEATITSAKEGVISRRQVQDNLIQTGRWLVDKFGGTSIGTLGGELVKWGLRLLGLIP